jgi:hypothetical protein
LVVFSFFRLLRYPFLFLAPPLLPLALRCYFLSPSVSLSALISMPSASIFHFTCLAHTPSAITRRRSPRSLLASPLPLPASFSLPLTSFPPAFLLYPFRYCFLAFLSSSLISLYPPLGKTSMLTIYQEPSSLRSPLPASASPSPPTAPSTKPRSSPPRTRPLPPPPSRPPRLSPRTARTGAAPRLDTARAAGRARGRRFGAIGRCYCCSGYAWASMA